MESNLFELSKFDKDELLHQLQETEEVDAYHDPELSIRLSKICFLFNSWLETRKQFEAERLYQDIENGLNDIEEEQHRQEKQWNELANFIDQINDALGSSD